MRKVALAARRVQFLRFLGRIILGSCSDHGRIGRALEMPLQLFSANFCQMLGGHFAWQAQYLVRLEGVDCCSPHCKWRFICDVDQSWDSFCVAGAAFGKVHVSLFVAGAAFGEVHVSLFVAGAAFGEVHVSLFVAHVVKFGMIAGALEW